jgi:hypothetical protein
MKDIVIVDINAPKTEVATLFSDPRNNPMWMDDVARYEPAGGKQGARGSKYRLIPKQGTLLFNVTVVENDLPDKLHLTLDSSTVIVNMRGTLTALPDGGTRLVSEEVFDFKTVWRKALGVITRPAIHKTHRRHMEAFKRFAEHSKTEFAPRPRTSARR